MTVVQTSALPISCLYDYQSECVYYESKPSLELTIEKLANAPLPWKLESEPLVIDSNTSWELAVENSSNQFDLAMEELANVTSDRFDRVEERLDELTSHFYRIQEQFHVLCEVISFNNMKNDPIMNGKNVVCDNGLYFDQSDASNVCFNEEISISYDNEFGMKFEPQETSINDSYIILLEDCVKNVGSKVIIAQESHMDVPLVNTQVTRVQGNIYESLEMGKPFPPLISLEHVALVVKPPFNDPSHPLIVNYSLTKSP